MNELEIDNVTSIADMQKAFAKSNKFMRPFPHGCKYCNPHGFVLAQKWIKRDKQYTHRQQRRCNKEVAYDSEMHDKNLHLTWKTKAMKINRDQRSKRYTHHQIAEKNNFIDEEIQ